MNKFVIIGIVLVIIVVAGVLYKQFIGSGDAPIETGVVKEFTIVSKKLEWRFEPESIEVTQGDRIKVHVINEDNFDHGFAIDAFGISQRLPASGSINVEFVATKSGEFPFYCSVSCSSSDNKSFGLKDGLVETGPYAGTFRGHFEHIGKFVVEALQEILGIE
ncbi:cupredoxin domain-containing protein [Candidatus Pacebacteria bacterium]|nr:cupredoxin domain-containing protein [Candidatus Paceibacterota bacterium]